MATLESLSAIIIPGKISSEVPERWWKAVLATDVPTEGGETVEFPFIGELYSRVHNVMECITSNDYELVVLYDQTMTMLKLTVVADWLTSILFNPNNRRVG